MKILVVNNMAPFLWGGAEELASHLVQNLNATPGVRAELLRIPFTWEPHERLPLEMLIARSFKLQDVDRVIGLKFPAYLLPHANKVLWLLHQYRQAYEMFGGPHSNIPDNEAGRATRDAIHRADSQCFAQCRAIYCNAATTQARLREHNGFEARVLMPPLNDGHLFHNEGAEDYLFAGGRINALKRQHLLLEAYALARPAYRLVIAGPPDLPADEERLRRAIEAHGLGDRVTLMAAFHSRETLAGLVNRSLACAYLPYDEDSIGYVTMEAFQAGKAVITVTDSGGLLPHVSEQQTGLVSEPCAEALAEKLRWVDARREQTRQMGLQAHAYWNGLGVNWPNIVSTLLS